MRIALAPTPTVGYNDTLALVLKIPEYLVGIGIPANRPNRYTNNQILAAFAVHVLAFAMRAALGKVERVVVQIQQSAHRGSALNDNVTPIAPITAIWPPTRDKLLTTKADTAVSPATTTYENFRLVNDTRTFQKALSFATSNERYIVKHAGTGTEESSASRSTSLCGMHADAPIFFASVLKLDHTIDQSKKRVVPPNTNIEPGFERCPTLSH
jgi:hypothetical protein